METWWTVRSSVLLLRGSSNCGVKALRSSGFLYGRSGNWKWSSVLHFLSCASVGYGSLLCLPPCRNGEHTSCHTILFAHRRLFIYLFIYWDWEANSGSCACPAGAALMSCITGPRRLALKTFLCWAAVCPFIVYAQCLQHYKISQIFFGFGSLSVW